jgi:hypothetical protein
LTVQGTYLYPNVTGKKAKERNRRLLERNPDLLEILKDKKNEFKVNYILTIP